MNPVKIWFPSRANTDNKFRFVLLIYWYVYISLNLYISFIPMNCLSNQNATAVLSIFAINAISQHFYFCKVYTTKGSLIFSFDRVYFHDNNGNRESFSSFIYLGHDPPSGKASHIAESMMLPKWGFMSTVLYAKDCLTTQILIFGGCIYTLDD